jgi:hypothetical protein
MEGRWPTTLHPSVVKRGYLRYAMGVLLLLLPGCVTVGDPCIRDGERTGRQKLHIPAIVTVYEEDCEPERGSSTRDE